MIWPPEFTVNELAGLPPKVTALAPVKPMPLMTVVVPPATGAALGRTLAILVDGADPVTEAMVEAGAVQTIVTAPTPATVRVSVAVVLVETAMAAGRRRRP